MGSESPGAHIRSSTTKSLEIGLGSRIAHPPRERLRAIPSSAGPLGGPKRILIWTGNRWCSRSSKSLPPLTSRLRSSEGSHAQDLSSQPWVYSRGKSAWFKVGETVSPVGTSGKEYDSAGSSRGVGTLDGLNQQPELRFTSLVHPLHLRGTLTRFATTHSAQPAQWETRRVLDSWLCATAQCSRTGPRQMK